MMVPWINNREIKYQEKIDKYWNVLNKLKLDYLNYEVNQLRFIINVLGGHSKYLHENISKIVSDKLRLSVSYIMYKNQFCHQLHT